MLPSCPHPSATCFCAQRCFARVRVDTRSSLRSSSLMKCSHAIGWLDCDLENLLFSYEDWGCFQWFAFGKLWQNKHPRAYLLVHTCVDFRWIWFQLSVAAKQTPKCSDFTLRTISSDAVCQELGAGLCGGFCCPCTDGGHPMGTLCAGLDGGFDGGQMDDWVSLWSLQRGGLRVFRILT